MNDILDQLSIACERTQDCAFHAKEYHEFMTALNSLIKQATNMQHLYNLNKAMPHLIAFTKTLIEEETISWGGPND